MTKNASVQRNFQENVTCPLANFLIPFSFSTSATLENILMLPYHKVKHNTQCLKFPPWANRQKKTKCLRFCQDTYIHLSTVWSHANCTLLKVKIYDLSFKGFFPISEVAGACS
jgi:hypothetical protein